jgi:hypothetical protein
MTHFFYTSRLPNPRYEEERNEPKREGREEHDLKESEIVRCEGNDGRVWRRERASVLVKYSKKLCVKGAKKA